MSRVISANLDGELGVDDTKTTKNVQVVVKTEYNRPGEQVIHRKSERRKIARDIFLVFEEQPIRRGSNRKKSFVKPKFGHLKVEEPISKARSRVNLLRDIKNEPKCFFKGTENPKNSSIGSSFKASVHQANVSKSIATNKKTEICRKTYQNKVTNSKKTYSEIESSSVNPIFLWAKQDDTRIIEVRCEDYDKRNRIRITKTTTGWRAIPRSDASTSRIVKYFQTPSISKINRETYDISSKTIDSDMNLIDQDHDTIHRKSHMSNEFIKNYDYEYDQNKVNNKDNFKSVGMYTCEVDCSVKGSNNNLNEVESQKCDGSEHVQDMENIFSNLAGYRSCTPELQLCAETGLFLRSESCKRLDKQDFSANESGLRIDIPNCALDTKRIPSEVNVKDSFDADSSNPKDLIEDADLLLPCNKDTITENEITSSLVKHSESSHYNQNDFFKKSCSGVEKTSGKLNTSKCSLGEQVKPTILPQILEEITEPPTNFSFNENGEIEEVSANFFQKSQNFPNNFGSAMIEENNFAAAETTNINQLQAINLPLQNSTSIVEGMLLTNPIDNTPKDLSLKKSEKVPSSIKTISQCAVTSSSDILIFPNQDEIPIEEPTTETFKNFILEQFMNLNALNSLPNTAIKKQKRLDPIDSEKTNVNVELPRETAYGTPCPIDTLIIDDNSNDEPATKKACRSLEQKSALEGFTTVAPQTALRTHLHEDPDPLTQLRLLLRNTQWKVPDPILVPKDRLGAVLASPAREIPLLITTRPELRLPEAFAFPHIIQNPNILVISMAQLEAIIKNEMDKGHPKEDVPLEAFSVKNAQAKSNQALNLNTKCSYVEGNSMSSDISAATLAVLNQMFWLPYFSQWSQDIIKTLKGPVGLQHQIPNFLTPFNSFSLGLQPLDELYLSYVKRISNSKVQATENKSPHCSASPMCLQAMGSFQNHVDFMLLQKLLQAQLKNFSSIDQPSSSLQKSQEASHCSNIVHKNTFNEQQMSTIQQQCSKEQTKSSLSASCGVAGNAFIDESELRKLSIVSKNKFMKSKPRLTCKSISNLLEPEVQAPRSVVINLSTANTANPEFLNLSKVDNCLKPNISSLSTSICEQTKLNFADMTIGQQNKSANLTLTPRTLGKSSTLHSAEDNTSLDHLFYSNANSGYNSQWNWTTVTAAGE